MLTFDSCIMIKPDIPFNEHERLIAVNDCLILDTEHEKEYDDITRMAAEICELPYSLITIVDENRQWFKSHHGLPVNQTSRDISFCAHAINNPDEIMIIMDARIDKRFHDNPLVINQPNLVFYLGVPLATEIGVAIGTLCVGDVKPRNLSERQIESLKSLANQVVRLIELRKSNNRLEKIVAEKTILLKEINHRVKNNLAMIMALLRTEKNKCDNVHFEGIFEELLSKMYSLSILQSELYMTDNYSTMNFGTFLKTIIEKINYTFGSKTNTMVETEISNISIDITQAIPLGLIANELLINCYKHAFKENAKNNLLVSLNKDKNNVITFIVNDNGKTSFDKNNHTGSGIDLIMDLANQIDAKVNFKQNEHGLSAVVTL